MYWQQLSLWFTIVICCLTCLKVFIGKRNQMELLREEISFDNVKIVSFFYSRTKSRVKLYQRFHDNHNNRKIDFLLILGFSKSMFKKLEVPII